MLPFLKLRSPRPQSIKFITDFSRRTGDLEVMSKPDIHLLALCYELEIERNGGDWRIRNTPSQRGLNGEPPAKEGTAADKAATHDEVVDKLQGLTVDEHAQEAGAQEPVNEVAQEHTPEDAAQEQPHQDIAHEVAREESAQEETKDPEPQQTGAEDVAQEAPAEEDEEDDEDGWITPSNLKKHQEKDATVSGLSEPIKETLQAALLTSDFAMQNVALRINLK